MTGRAPAMMLAGALLALSGCNNNTAPGNDRNARLDAAPTPAPRMGAGAALAGVATEVVQPETMSEADIASFGGMDGRCAIRLTAVGLPSFVHDGSAAVIKLNGKLIPLAAAGEGRFASEGLHVAVRPVEREFDAGGRREAELIVMLPGAPDELGFRGYEQCPAG